MSAWILGIHLLTAHASGGYETVTPGLYAIHESGATFGAYRNSIGRPSAYAGYTASRGDYALTVGVVTGYKRKCSAYRVEKPEIGTFATGETCTGFSGGDIALLVAPSVRIGNARVTILANKRPAAHLSWEF